MRPDWCPLNVWNTTKAYPAAWGEAIATAVLKERTRCAEIARNWPDHTEGRGIAERIMDDAR